MKLRTPKTFASAITRLKNGLSEEVCAREINRSPSLVRKWADPDHPSVPNLVHAAILDAVYVRAGLGDPPLLDALEHEIEKLAESEEDPPPVDIVTGILAVQASVGDLSEAISDVRSHNSPGGEAITQEERIRILSLIEQLQDEIESIEDAIAERERST